LITAKGDLIAPATISPDQVLIPYSGAKTIRTWDYKKDNNGPEFPYFDSNAPGLAPTALAFSPDSATLAVGLNNGRIILFKVATGQPLVVVEPPPNVKNSVRLLAWSPDGNLLVVGREKSFETLSIDFNNGLASPTALGIALSAPTSSLSFNADGKRLAVSSQNGEIQLWSLDNNQMINRIITGPDPIIGLRWSQDNQQITAATGGSHPVLNTYATQPVQRSLKVALTPRNGTKVTGNAQLTELPGGLVRVTLNVEGLEPGQHKVHIHAGSCANQGDIKFDLETLRATADGKAASTTVIKVDYTALTTGSFYVNVHNDPGTDTYIASCGEIHV
jgi:WD40 repeat protein